MKRRGLAIPILLLAFVTTACAPKLTGKPRWVNEPHRDYPADRFLVGVATGETCEQAVDLAIARIAQQIEVRVNATEQRRSLINTMNTVGSADSNTLETHVSLTTDATLLGIEIIETLPLPSGSCAARAALDIDRSITLYDAAINQKEREIESTLRSADLPDSAWIEYVHVSSAFRLAINRDVLAMTRGGIASRGDRDPAPVGLLAPGLIDRYTALRDALSLSVVRIGDCPPGLITAAEECLTRCGLPIERDHPGAIQLRIGWQARPEQTYDPAWWVCRWRMTVTLYDAEQGVTIASHSPPEAAAYGLGRQAAIEESQSDAAAMIDQAIDIVLHRPGAYSPW